MKITEELQKAEYALGRALSLLGDMEPGSIPSWIGAWGDYKRIGQTLAKVQNLRARVERNEKRARATTPVRTET